MAKKKTPLAQSELGKVFPEKKTALSPALEPRPQSIGPTPQEKETELQRKVLGAGRNEGIDVRTGQAVPVITMQGPREQVFQKQFADSNLPVRMALEQQAVQQQRMAQAAPLIGQIGVPTAMGTQNEMPIGSSIKSVLPEVAGSAIEKAAIGAGGGAIVGGPVGAAIGGVGGAIAGGLQILSKLKDEERQNTLVQKVEFTTSQKNIKAIIDGVNKGAIDPIDAVALYNRELGKIDRAERNLKQLSEREWLSKAKDELTRIRQFNDVERARTGAMLEQAILKPNPLQAFDLPIETEAAQ